MKKHIVIDARESGTSTGRYIDKLVEHLYQLRPNYKITIVTKPKRLEFIGGIAPKFDVISSRYKEFTFAEQTGFLKQIRGLKPDLVHFGMTQQPILFRGKVVTTIHDLTTGRFRNPAKNWLIFTIKQMVYRQVIKIVAKKSQAIITGSEYVKDDVAKYARINSRKITVTHEAADKITAVAEPIEELEGKQYIMYVGRPQSHKNLERLIETFINLRQSHPELRLVLVGKRDLLYKRLAKKAEQAGQKNILFTGFVSEGQLKWLYQNTAAYVFPSLSEGFGLPALEAMVHGAPVVSSNATCLPEIYQDGALYFDPLDIGDMAEKIKSVLNDPTLRKKLIEKGGKVAVGYSWARMAKQTLGIYEDLLEDD